IWLSLMLWRDLNHNGVCEPQEILPLSQSRVTAIDLQYHFSGRHDSFGNSFRYMSRCWIADAHGQTIPRSLYDISFVVVVPVGGVGQLVHCGAARANTSS